MPTDHEQELLDTLEHVGHKEPVLPSLDAQTTSEVEEGSLERPPPPMLHVPEPPATVTAKNFWRHPDAHPIALDTLVVRKFGADWLTWEPETLQIRIPEAFGTQSLSDLNLAKLQACRVLHLVDTFWRQWEIFAACLAPFNGEFPDFEVLRPPTVAQVLVACDVAARIRNDVGWSDEVKEYVRTVYQHDGIYMPLPPADFAPPGTPEDFSLDDVAELSERWPDVRRTNKPPVGNTQVDEQLRRIHTAWNYLEESRTHLQVQLDLLHA